MAAAAPLARQRGPAGRVMAPQGEEIS
jgi:hypothetical protein